MSNLPNRLMEVSKRYQDPITVMTMRDAANAIARLHDQLVVLQTAHEWIIAAERMPEAGQLIVKRFANGSVWAGTYHGGPKESSFVAWKGI